MFDNNKPYVLVFGASVVDIFGFSSCCYRPYNSTPGVVKMSFGGVCRNIAENLARVDVNTKFISILGDDEKGRSMLEHSRLIGYDMEDSLILEDSGTPTYLAILNEYGEMVSSIADMKSIDQMNTDFIDSKAELIENAEYTFLDSDSPEIMEYLLLKFKGQTKFILDPVSAEKATNIRHLIKHFHSIKPNRHEAEVMTGFEIRTDDDLILASDHFIEMGVKNVFISLDEDGIFYSNGREAGKIKSTNVTVKNVTGAGDSFVAGLGYGYMNELNLLEAVKFAVTMANLTISHEETIHPDMAYEAIKEIKSNTEWIYKDLSRK